MRHHTNTHHSQSGSLHLIGICSVRTLIEVESDRGRASGRLHEALQAAEAEALAEKEAEGGRVARDRELPKPERNIARLDCADVLLSVCPAFTWCCSCCCGLGLSRLACLTSDVYS
eukprot:2405914-Rhodomonas_salina.1